MLEILLSSDRRRSARTELHRGGSTVKSPLRLLFTRELGTHQDAYVLCKIFKKSGLGPKIGEHYGASFNEGEWDNVNTEAVFPLMPCLSSEVVGATNKPPCQLTVASADGLPFEFSTSSITAIDEVHAHTLRHNGSEMVTANHASDALDACDPTEFGVISLEEIDKWATWNDCE
ncbi:hypothetical protein PVAP13_5KG674407 [Panicum virgatum]|uniref:Uncharacterized protein n=1 Tax=Panicum virgatum TaxID=38727 RepID=A0A8T0SYE3_PANVG|nr:hypothetical protein PVAP13_5KG674407 [Panicum virgatum]KAG2602359.1 hypothetical protein PVAP13_5KG674407 [Panicum virgatum]